MKNSNYLHMKLSILAIGLLMTIGTVNGIQANINPRLNTSAGDTFVSDDFNYCNLASHWTFIDPKGDSTFTLNGTQILIELPPNSNHDLWENVNTAPRIMQSINNSDFEIEVQFNTTVNSKFQIQGIIIQQDDNNKLRFDFFNDGEDTNIFYAKFENGIVTESQNSIITSGSGLAMQIERQGDVYSQRYRIDNQPWQSHLSITYAGLGVNQAGVFAGNVGSADPAPAFTSAVDYVFNTDSPIVPEDSDAFTLSSSVSGPGSLNVNPIKNSYNCGEEVTLTATANSNAVFTGWGGTISGHGSPRIIQIMGDTNVIANFTAATDFLYIPFLSNEGDSALPFLK